jgi:hypothetical protein
VGNEIKSNKGEEENGREERTGARVRKRSCHSLVRAAAAPYARRISLLLINSNLIRKCERHPKHRQERMMLEIRAIVIFPQTNRSHRNTGA